MITHHLLRMSLENLAVRYGRSLFLVLGVAVGTGTLAFLIATYKPPLGIVGGAMNTLGLHRFAEDSLNDLFDRIAAALQG